MSAALPVPVGHWPDVEVPPGSESGACEHWGSPGNLRDPSRRSSAPNSPGAVHAATPSRIRFFSLALNLRRGFVGFTSVGGLIAPGCTIPTAVTSLALKVRYTKLPGVAVSHTLAQRAATIHGTAAPSK